MNKPYYKDDLVELWHGDCREITAWLTADVLVCDPPYGRAWRQGRIKAAGLRANGGRASEGAPNTGISGDLDTSVRDTILATWGDRPAIAFGDLMLAPPAGTKQVCVYRKPPDAGNRGATARRRRDLEAIYLVGRWPSGLGGKSSLFTTSAPVIGTPVGLAARYGHPHAKPVDVMEQLVMMAEGVVADPCAGAGSTLIACRNLGRRAIGVELEERYCERIVARLDQGALPFGEPA